MTAMMDEGGGRLPDSKGAVDLDRLTALAQMIDSAEMEAVALNALDARMCLQLARLAVLSKTAKI